MSADLTHPRPDPYPPEIKALHTALAKAQAEFPPIPREKTVKTGSYSFSYAPLDTILAAVRPVLAKHGLAIIQRLESPNGVPAIRTELLHAEGAAIASSFPLGELPASPQQLGSLLTYLRRYTLVSMLAVAAEDDDDGQQAPPAVQASRKAPAPDPRPEREPASAVPAPAEDVSSFPIPDLQASVTGADAISDAQRKKIYALRSKLVKADLISEEQMAFVLSADFGTESISELTKAQASNLIERLVAKEKEIEG